ncbi:hypothetical protein ASR47_103144 [Janthinobacterium psychrotolerans]|uniref:Uncharacterized protein n=1 Tax=Janthinobacterium psychrotolerans TaxID=1747903 RepID=A0A1A7C6W7_9BURK|nr:hypothetical protein ASR47_103144 [Janthinobacterium psychrotolerans]
MTLITYAKIDTVQYLTGMRMIPKESCGSRFRNNRQEC